MNKIIKKINTMIKDERGSALPMIAVVLILTIFVGAVNFSLVVMYRDRSAVRNALDAGVASSLAAKSSLEERNLNYGYRTSCIKSIKEPYTNKEGKEKTRRVCIKWAYENTESGPMKNYIYLNKEQASRVAKEYFEKNLKLNNINNYKIVSWEYFVTYDKDRYYTINKDRGLNWSDSDYVNRLTNPDDWWVNEFGDKEPEPWSSEPETRLVRFPRWVMAKAKVRVELTVPLGKLLGKETYETSFKIDAVKELIEIR